MKILFCNKYNYRFSGAEVYLFELMETLRANGHDVALFSMDTLCASGCDAPIDFKSRDLTLCQRLRLAGHAIYSVQARQALRRLIAEFRPDVAHVRNIYHHLSPSVLWELRERKVPVIYHLNDFKLICPSYNLVCRRQICERCRGGHFLNVLTSGCYAGPAGATAVLAAEAYVHKWIGSYRKCVARFLAPSHFVREKLIENGWDERRIQVLYHPQASPAEPPPCASADAPILYFGRLSAEKGLLDLLRAMQQLPKIHLQVIGEGPQRAELHHVAGQLALRNVDFRGHLQSDDLRAAIVGARFTILPSLAYETLGKSILESYACARPVIATDLGSRRELVTDGQTGLLYRAGDHDALASAIAFLSSQPELVRRMGIAGFELVRERHAPQKHYCALMRLYTEVTSPAAVTLRQPPRKLSIAFIGGRGVGSKYSGIETWYEEVGRRLAERGHSVTAYCRNYFTPDVARYKGMEVVRLPTIRSKQLDTLFHTALSTLHATCRHYDVVHFHALGPALFSFVPRLAGKKTIVSVQGLDWKRQKWGRLAAAVLRTGEAAAALLPNRTIVVSRTLQAYYETLYRAMTAYVPNGTTLTARGPVRHLAFWGLESDHYVLFLGRFSPEKHCDLLIRAFASISTDFKLVLAGGSSYSDEYVESLCRQQTQRILLLDWQEGKALEELLTHAAIFVLPSDVEGLSLALLDAMAAGICVLASDVPENRELVDGVGFTFGSGDEDDLRRKLCTLIGDARLRAEAGRAARERVRQNYLWDAVADSIEDQYARLTCWHEPLTASVPGEVPTRAAPS